MIEFNSVGHEKFVNFCDTMRESGIFSIMSSACMWGWYNQFVSQWDRDEQVTGLIGLLCQLACRVVSVGM